MSRSRSHSKTPLPDDVVIRSRGATPADITNPSNVRYGKCQGIKVDQTLCSRNMPDGFVTCWQHRSQEGLTYVKPPLSRATSPARGILRQSSTPTRRTTRSSSTIRTPPNTNDTSTSTFEETLLNPSYNPSNSTKGELAQLIALAAPDVKIHPSMKKADYVRVVQNIQKEMSEEPEYARAYYPTPPPEKRKERRSAHFDDRVVESIESSDAEESSLSSEQDSATDMDVDVADPFGSEAEEEEEQATFNYLGDAGLEIDSPSIANTKNITRTSKAASSKPKKSATAKPVKKYMMSGALDDVSAASVNGRSAGGKGAAEKGKNSGRKDGKDGKDAAGLERENAIPSKTSIRSPSASASTSYTSRTSPSKPSPSTSDSKSKNYWSTLPPTSYHQHLRRQSSIHKLEKAFHHASRAASYERDFKRGLIEAAVGVGGFE